MNLENKVVKHGYNSYRYIRVYFESSKTQRKNNENFFLEIKIRRRCTVVYFFMNSDFRKCFTIPKKKLYYSDMHMYIVQLCIVGRKIINSTQHFENMLNKHIHTLSIYTGCIWMALIKIHVVAYYISAITFYYENIFILFFFMYKKCLGYMV